jgi:hypothetical protein
MGGWQIHQAQLELLLLNTQQNSPFLEVVVLRLVVLEQWQMGQLDFTEVIRTQ